MNDDFRERLLQKAQREATVNVIFKKLQSIRDIAQEQLIALQVRIIVRGCA